MKIPDTAGISLSPITGLKISMGTSGSIPEICLKNATFA
jgi:hypothetical protein